MTPAQHEDREHILGRAYEQADLSESRLSGGGKRLLGEKTRRVVKNSSRVRIVGREY